MKPIISMLTFCLALSLGLIFGCGGEGDSVSVDDRFLGNWKYTKFKTHRIMIFKANGSWTGEIRVEGRLAKIIEKKEKVNGTWDFKDGVLSVTPTETSEGGGWQKDVTVNYEVIEISPETLSLRLASGELQPFARIRSQRAADIGSQLATISMQPIAVNLSKGKRFKRNRYLCIELELALNITPEEMVTVQLHPRVTEATIFYLSSLTYNEVSTIEKLDLRREKLLQVLKPYLGGRLEELTIKNVVVTTKWRNVESFLKQYSEAEGEAGEEKAEKTS